MKIFRVFVQKLCVERVISLLFQVLCSCVSVWFYKFILYNTFNAFIMVTVLDNNDTARLAVQLLAVAI